LRSIIRPAWPGPIQRRSAMSRVVSVRARPWTSLTPRLAASPTRISRARSVLTSLRRWSAAARRLHPARSKSPTPSRRNRCRNPSRCRSSELAWPVRLHCVVARRRLSDWSHPVEGNENGGHRAAVFVLRFSI